MPWQIRELNWDDRNVEHIARHGIGPQEVDEACSGEILVRRAKGRDRLAVFGRTAAGRYVVVFLAKRGAGSYYPITARDMEGAERRLYRESLGR